MSDETTVAPEATETEAAPKVYVPLAQDPIDDIYLVVTAETGAAEALTPFAELRMTL